MTIDLCHSGLVTHEPGGRGGSRVPALRNEWREPLRAKRDPLASDSGRVRSNREDRRRWRKQTWLGRFVSTYGWRAYALPVLTVLTGRRVTDPTSGLWAFGPKAVSMLADHHPSGYPEPELRLFLSRNRLRAMEIPVTTRARPAGQTSLTARRTSAAMARLLLHLVVVPLRGAVRERS